MRAVEAKSSSFDPNFQRVLLNGLGGYKVARNLIANLVESMGITKIVAIHLDHGHYEDDAHECIEVGYTSIMFDGSHLPVEENLKLAKEVVEKAHAKGISV